MSKARLRTICMGFTAVLLIPIGYAMLTRRWGLAAVCALGIAALRWIGFGRGEPDDDS